jgi:hypothetical protein
LSLIKYGANPIINKLIDFRERIFKNISYELDNKSFKEYSKGILNKVFIRNRKLTLKNVILLILTMKSSLQRDLDRFMKTINKSDFNIREVIRGHFQKHVKKIRPEAFLRLNTIAVNAFYEGAEYNVWGGHRLLSVDGTTLKLPNHPTVVEEFGSHLFGCKAACERSLSMCSTLYDVLNLITLDAAMAPYATSETKLLPTFLTNYKRVIYCYLTVVILFDFCSFHCRRLRSIFVFE